MTNNRSSQLTRPLPSSVATTSQRASHGMYRRSAHPALIGRPTIPAPRTSARPVATGRVRTVMLLFVVAVGALFVRAEIANARTSATAVESTTRPYTVLPGDTLWSIARTAKPSGNLRPTIARIVRDSQLHGATQRLQPGDVLQVPVLSL